MQPADEPLITLPTALVTPDGYEAARFKLSAPWLSAGDMIRLSTITQWHSAVLSLDDKAQCYLYTPCVDVLANYRFRPTQVSWNQLSFGQNSALHARHFAALLTVAASLAESWDNAFKEYGHVVEQFKQRCQEADRKASEDMSRWVSEKRVQVRSNAAKRARKVKRGS